MVTNGYAVRQSSAGLEGPLMLTEFSRVCFAFHFE